MIVIPAMDLMDGQCVRLRGGDFNQLTSYSTDPLEVAEKLAEAGFHRLHMVDLDGAKSGSPKHLHVLEKVAAGTSLVIDFSGGIKTDANIESVFAKGASLAAVGSIAVKNKSLFFQWLEKYGSDKILLGVDVREEKLAISGWLEQTAIGLFTFLNEMTSRGVAQIFCTDIGRDGMMSGPSVELYQKILQSFPGIKLIASGGVSHPNQLEQLQEIGCAGAIVGKAIYENFDQLDIWLK
ncbi:MAG: 1-(5-phosphoribosyl)-5-[(5-phosphoribosylamino)methylideneamino] imidazole-4-carboxamide isomerase [Bacteroidota bacterium]